MNTEWAITVHHVPLKIQQHKIYCIGSN